MYNRKTDVGKHAILSHFSSMKTPNSNSRSKHTPHGTILYLLLSSPTGIFRLIVLLRGQSSFASFPPANRPVERSKLAFAVRPAVASAVRSAMRPAVPHLNRIYKQNS